MAYLTVDEVRELYTGIDEAITRRTLTEGVVERWISNSQSIIDGMLSISFEVPFTEVPPLVKTLTIELFEYFWQKAVYTPTSTGEEVPWLYARYDRIMNLLDKIAVGVVKLVDSDGNIIEPIYKVAKLKSNYENQEPIFDIEREVYENDVPENYGKEGL